MWWWRGRLSWRPVNRVVAFIGDFSYVMGSSVGAYPYPSLVMSRVSATVKSVPGTASGLLSGAGSKTAFGNVEPALRDAVVSLMAGSETDRTDDRLDWLAGLLEEDGSITFAKGFAWGVADGAEAAFPEAFRSAIQPDNADVIRRLVDYVVGRTADLLDGRPGLSARLTPFISW